MSAANPTDPIGCSVSSTELTAAGSRGSDAAINSHPTTWELSARMSSQPALGQLGTSRASPITTPASTQMTAETRVASNSGPASLRKSDPPWRSSSRKPT